jgi:protein-tyrosine phosphatase
VYDLHTHILPGVDDGSPSIEVSVDVLRRFGAEGVEVVVCTPHLDASAAGRAPHDRYLDILTALRAAAPAVPRLELGWEIMLDMPGVDLRDRRLGLARSSAVLVELSRTSIPPNTTAELFRIRMSGITPVLAHPERYYGCTPELMAEWRGAGAVTQLDAATLFGGGRRRDLTVQFLERGLLDVVASDNHGDGRNMASARQWLMEVGGEVQAELMLETNPRNLLESKPLVEVPPLAIRRGMLDRLRELFRGRQRSGGPR